MYGDWPLKHQNPLNYKKLKVFSDSFTPKNVVVL